MYKDNMVYYPKDEMNTYLLPVTVGCAYNKCAFCSMYKDDKYGKVPLSDIKMELLNGYLYTEKVFLTGADPMSIGFLNMKEILDIIHEYLPYCACVSTYASIKSIKKYSVKELTILHNKGLRLLYIGFETGKDEILKLMNKGHTVSEAICQGNKLNKANILFNTIIMYGIAGKEKYEENAVETAEMINQFITNKIITMNLKVFQGTQLSGMVEEGKFLTESTKERLAEIKILLGNLKPKSSMIFDTTHPTNIIKIKGVLPKDREKLIEKLGV